MKTKQRLFVSLFMAILPLMASAYDVKFNGIYYNLDASTKTATVTQGNSDEYYSGTVSIPSTIKPDGVTYTVKTIGRSAFYICDKLTAVTIPTSVTTINDFAFCGAGLTSVKIPGSVKTIGTNVFNECEDLTTVQFGKGVTTIGQNMFQQCVNLKNVTLPSTLKTIYYYAFYQCKSLQSITIPDGVENINSYAFDGSGLRSITIPSSVKNIGWYAFYYCNDLISITINSVNPTISDEAFTKCYNIQTVSLDCQTIGNWFAKSYTLETVVLGSHVKTIGEGAFKDCSELRNLTIGNNVTTIGKEAFSGIYELNSVTIPNSVTTIGEKAFAYCGSGSPLYITFGTGLTTVAKDAFAGSRYGFSFNNSNTSILPSLIDPGGLVHVSFGSNVTAIPAHTFSKCDCLEYVYIGKNVKSIGEGAFYECYNLTTVQGGSNVVSIGNSAFYDCPNLEDITLIKNVVTIGDEAFSCCYMLEEITLGEGIKTIGKGAFASCFNLEKVYIYAKNIPTADATSFDKMEVSDATLYVQSSLLSTYKKRVPWSYFASIQPLQTGITTDIDRIQNSSLSEAAEPNAQSKAQSELWYTFDGQKLNGKPTKKGVYINNGQQVVIK